MTIIISLKRNILFIIPLIFFIFLENESALGQEFTTQPSDTTICQGNNASVSVAFDGGFNPNYRWEVNDGGGWVDVTNDAVYNGEDQPTLNITNPPLIFNTYRYRCTVGYFLGEVVNEESEIATLFIDSLPNPIITITSNGGSNQLCGENIDLTGSGFVGVQTNSTTSGLWQFTAGGNTLAPTDNPVTAATLDRGDNTITWSVTNGVCPEQTSNPITITSDRDPAAANAGDDIDLCENSNVSLAAITTALNAGDQISWTPTATSGAGNVATPSSATSGVTGIGYGQNQFELVIKSEYEICPNSAPDYVTITRDRTPDGANAGADQLFCETTTTSLNAVTPKAGDQISWSPFATAGAGTVTTLASATSGVTGLGYGQNVFELVIKSQFEICANSTPDYVTIRRDRTPGNANAGNAISVCEVTTANLAAITSGLNSGDQISWTASATTGTGTVTSPSSATSAVTGLGYGDNEFELFIKSQFDECPQNGPDYVIIIRDKNPTPSILQDDGDGKIEVCLSDADNTTTGIQLEGDIDPPTATGEWRTATATPLSSNTAQQTFTNLQRGNNTFTWELTSGTCTQDVSIIVERDVPVTAPNITQPNDGDHFCVAEGVNFLVDVDESIGESITFTFSNGGSQSQQGEGDYIITGMGEGNNKVTYKVQSNFGTCPSEDTFINIIGDAVPATANITQPTEGQKVCNEIIDILADDPTNTDLNSSGTWSISPNLNGESFQNQQYDTKVLNLQKNTTYVLEYDVANLGVCPPSHDQVSFEFADIEFAELTSGDVNLCFGERQDYESRQLIAGENEEWTLLDSDATTILRNEVGVSVFSFDGTEAAKSYYLVHEIFNGTFGCTASDTTQINVNAPATTPTGTNPAAICLNDETEVDISINPNGYDGSWNNDNGGPNFGDPSNPVQSAIDFNGFSEGEYNYTWTPDPMPGCDNGEELAAALTITVTLNEISSATLPGGDYDFCNGGQLAPVVDGNDVFVSWSVNSGPGVIDNPTNENTTISGMAEGEVLTVDFNITDGACSSTQTATITEYGSISPPNITSPLDGFQICGDNMNLTTDVVIDGDETERWEIIHEATTDVFSNVNHTFTNEGNFEVIYTVEKPVCGEEESFPVTGTRFIQPTAVITSDTTNSICSSEQLEISATLGAANVGAGEWIVRDALNNIYSNHIFSAGNANSLNATVENFEVGDYTIFWRVTNGNCTDEAGPINLEVEEGLTAAIIKDAAINENVCISNATITLESENALKVSETGTFQILSGENTVITEQSSTNETVTYNLVATGEATIQFIIEDLTLSGCPNADTVEYTFNVRPELNQPTADDPAAICFTDGFDEVLLSVNLNGDLIGNQNMSGAWSPDVANAFVEAIENGGLDLRISDLLPGTYSYTWTSTNNACADKSTSVTVQVDELTGTVDADNLTSPNAFSICPPEPFNLRAADPTPDFGTWTVTNGTGSITGGQENLNSAEASGLTPKTASTFTWTVTQGACNAADQVEVTLLDDIADFTIDLTSDSCSNNGTLITRALDLTNEETGIWTAQPSTGVSFSDDDNPSTNITVTDNGTYKLTWTIDNGCTQLAKFVYFNFYNAPDIPDGVDFGSICEDTHDINATIVQASNGESGSWVVLFDSGGGNIDVTGTAISSGSSTTPSITINTTDVGDYTCTWTITNACGSDAQSFTVERGPNLTVADAGSNQNICTDVTNLAGNEPAAGESGLWTSSDPFVFYTPNANTYNAQVSNLQAGTTTFTWKISNGLCDDATNTSTMEVYVADGLTNPTQATASVEHVCDNTPISLTGNQPVTANAENGVWQILHDNGIDPQDDITDDAGTFANGSTKADFEADINPTIAGTYTCIWTVSNPCNLAGESAQVEIIRYADDIELADAAIGIDPNEVTTCGALYNLNANTSSQGEINGLWTKVSGPGNVVVGQENSPTASVENLNETTPTKLRWTLRSGTCAVSFSDITITRSGDLTVPVVTDPDDICTNEITLEVTNGQLKPSETGVWTLEEKPVGAPDPTLSQTSFDENDTNYDLTINIANAEYGVYKYKWEIDNPFCDPPLFTIVEFEYFETPEPANAAQNNVTSFVVCQDETDDIQLDAVAGVVGTGAWSSTPGDITFNDVANPKTTTNVDFSAIPTGNYTLTWTLTNGVCNTSDNVTLAVLPTISTPTLGVIPDEVCVDEVQLAADPAVSANGEQGTWTVSGANTTGITFNPNANDENAIAENLSEFGTYTFTWTIDNGGNCDTKSVSKDVEYLETPADGNAGSDIEICETDASPQLSATPVNLPNQGIWTSTTPGITFTVDLAGTSPDANNPEAFVQNAGIGSHVLTWTINNSICESSPVNITLTVYEEPTAANADVGGATPTTICISDTITLDANTPAPVTATGQWTSDDLANTEFLDGANNPNTRVKFLTDKTFNLTWTTYNGTCESAPSAIAITVEPIPVTPEAGADKDICADTEALVGNDPLGLDVEWKQSTSNPAVVIFDTPNSASTNVSNILAVNDTNLYTFYYEINTNSTCGVLTDSVKITRYKMPVVDPLSDFAGPDQSLCFDFTDFDAELQAGIGVWSKDNMSSGGDIVDVNDPKSTVNNLDRNSTATVNTTFIWTVENGICGSYSDEVTLSVKPFPVPDALVGADPNVLELCNVTETDMNAVNSVATTKSWSVVSPVSASITFTPNNEEDAHVTGLVPGTTYVFAWTLDNGDCPQTDEVTVIVHENPTPAVVDDNDVTICASAGTTYQFNAEPAISPTVGTWTKEDGPAGGDIDDVNNNAATVSNLVPGLYQYRWTTSNGTCADDFVNVELTVKEIPYADAGQNDSLCEETTNYTFNANVPDVDLNQVGAWSKVSGDGTIAPASINDPMAEVTGLSIGANQWRWTVSNGTCETSDDVVIKIKKNPSNAQVAADASTCDDFYTIEALGNIDEGRGVWSVVSGGATIIDTTAKVTTVTGLTDGVNEFKWSVKNGPCTAKEAVQTITKIPEPSNAEAGTVDDVCVGTPSVSLNASDLLTYETGEWTLTSGNIPLPTFDKNDPKTTVSGLEAGVYNFTWTITTGCGTPTSDNVSFTVQPEATPIDAGQNRTVCTDTVYLNASTPTPGNGHWETASGASIFDINDPNTLVEGLDDEIDYTFTWVVENLPCNNQDASVTITRKYPADEANAGIDQIICETDPTATLSANNPTVGAGKWTLESGSGNIANDTDFETTVSNLGLGENIFRWTISTVDCGEMVDDVSLTVVPEATIVNAGDDFTICNDTLYLNAVDPDYGTGHWELGAGNVSKIHDVNDKNSMVTNLGYVENSTFTFKWVVENGTCAPQEDEVVVTRVLPQAQANAGEDISICTDEYQLNGNNDASAATSTWSVVVGQGLGTFDDATIHNATISGLRNGSNSLTWQLTKEHCPVSIDTVNIFVQPRTSTVNAGLDQTVCADTVVLSASALQGDEQGQWEAGNGIKFFNDTLPNTTVHFLPDGISTLRWVVKNGVCPEEFDELTITRETPIALENPAGEDQEICADVTELNGKSETGTTSLWEVIPGQGQGTFAGGVNTIPNATIQGLRDGENHLKYTLSKGSCPSVLDTVMIWVQPRTNPITLTGDHTICVDSTELIASSLSGDEVGYWESDNGSLLFTAGNNEVTTVKNLSFGDNTIRWVVENGVCPPEIATVVVTRLIPPTQANAGEDQWICADNTQLEGNDDPNAKGTWALIPGEATGTITNINQHNTVINGLPDGLHKLTWTLENGLCPATTDTVEIRVQPRTSTVYAGEDQVLCVDSAMLSATPLTQGVGHWEGVATTALIVNLSNSSTKVTNLNFGNNEFAWIVENGPCPIEQDIIVINRNQPVEVANAGEDQRVCSNATTLDADEVFIGSGSWEVLQGGATVSNSNDPKSTVTDLNILQDNILLWKVDGGTCDASTDTVIIKVDRAPTPASINQSFLTLCDDELILDGNDPNIGVGHWKLVTGSGTFADSTDESTLVSGLAPGSNILRWIITSGVCDTSFAEKEIFRYEEPSDPIVKDDFNICDSVAEIDAVDPLIGQGSWVSFNSGNQTIEDDQALITNVGGLTFGSNRFAWIVRNGICPVKSAIVDVFRDTPPTDANAGLDIEVCGTETQLNAETPQIGEGYWTDVTGNIVFDDTSSTDAMISNLMEGENELFWTTINGACVGTTDAMIVTSLSVPVVNAGDDIELCEVFTETLSANTLTNLESGVWRLQSGSGLILDSLNSLTSITNLDYGVNSFVRYVENTIGCFDSDTVNITVHQNPSNAVATSITDVCEIFSFEINAEAPVVGQGEWITKTLGDTVEVPTASASILNIENYGEHIITWKVSNGTCPADSVEIIFSNYETPSDAIVQENDTICVGEYVVSANPITIGTGVWREISGGYSIEDSTVITTNIFNLTNGDNIIEWEVSNGVCPSKSAQLIITKLEDLTLPLITIDGTVCEDEFMLQGSTPKNNETALWEVQSGDIVLDQVTEPLTSASGNTPGLVTVLYTISNDKCNLTESVNFDFYGTTPPANAGDDQLLCENFTEVMTETLPKGELTWEILGLGLIENRINNTTEITALDTGITKVVLTTSLGDCPQNTDTLILNHKIGPNILLEPVYQTQAGVAEQLIADVEDAIDITWTPPIGLSNAKIPNPTAVVSETTSFTVIAINAFGCESMATTTVEVLEIDPDALVPVNLFSPNGDGVNDFWTINEESLALGCNVQIFDRYGVLVFNATNYANQWDGTKDGELLPEGTYYYMISCGNTQEQGAITLLR